MNSSSSFDEVNNIHLDLIFQSSISLYHKNLTKFYHIIENNKNLNDFAFDFSITHRNPSNYPFWFLVWKYRLNLWQFNIYFPEHTNITMIWNQLCRALILWGQAISVFMDSTRTDNDSVSEVNSDSRFMCNWDSNLSQFPRLGLFGEIKTEFV